MCIVFVVYQVNGPLVSSCTISKIALKVGARQSRKREADLILFIWWPVADQFLLESAAAICGFELQRPVNLRWDQ